MKWFFIIPALLVFLSSFAHADSHIARFVFITELRVTAPGVISDVITVQAQSVGGEKVDEVGETVDIEFSSNSPSGEFLNSLGNPISTVMARNTANRHFYYRDSTSGTFSLKVKAIGRESGKSWTATHQITISTRGSEINPSLASSSQGSLSSTSLPAIAPSKANIIFPAIKADAGGDKTITTGSMIEFRGSALGLKNEPLENVRFWWNFGDGNFKEGRVVNNIFQMPGTYTVGLHISSGEHAASDFITVSVVSNQLTVLNVITGKDGYVQLINNGKTEIDLGGWILEDQIGKRFLVPQRTKIASQAEVALLNSVTSLLLENAAPVLIISYPNGREAILWKEEKASVAVAVNIMSKQVKTVAEVTRPPVFGEKENVSIDGEKNIEADAVAEQKEFAGIATGSGFSGMFLGLAFLLSIVAAAGFLIFRVYGKT